MKKSNLIFALLMLITVAFYAQVTTIVNYDFNSVSAYPIQPSATASSITCSGTSSEPFQTFTGIASGTGAFASNTTAGNAIAMSNSSGTNTRYFLFQLGGSDLSSYQSYKLYFQPQRSSTGANLITVAYSTNGSSYTNFSTTYAVSTSFSDVSVDLSSITALNNVSSVYIKLLVAGATATAGTIRIDNFQIQANKAGSGGGGSNPWTVSGSNVNFTGNVGIGTASPVAPLDVNGNANINGNLTTTASKNITAGGNIIGNSNLTIAGTSTFNGDVITSSNKNITAGGNIIGNGNIDVSGNATLGGSLKLPSLVSGTKSSIVYIDSLGNLKTYTPFPTPGLPSPCTSGATPWFIGGNLMNTNQIYVGQFDVGTCDANDFVLKANNNKTIFLQTDKTVSFGAKILSNTGGPEYKFHQGAMRLSGGNTFGGPQIIFDNDAAGVSPYGDWGIEYTGGTGAANAGLNFWKPFGSPYAYNNLLFLADNGNIGVNTDVPTSRLMVDSWTGDAISTLTSNHAAKQLSLKFKDLSNNNTITENFVVNGDAATWIGANVMGVGNSQVVIGQGIKTAKAISLVDNSTSANRDYFNVYGNGYTEINVYSPSAMPSNRVFAIKDLANNKDLFVVKSDGKIYSREVEISLATTFPDYVFAKDYKLKSLSEVETYINKNKHLPNFEKGEYYEKNGFNVTDMLLKQQQTIEELMLYNIELEKRLKALEEKN